MKKLIKLTTLCLAMLILLSACATTPDEKQPVNKTVSSEQTETSSIIKPKGKFDIEEVRKSVVLNGKKITLPCKVSDLGDDYYIDNSAEFKWRQDEKDPSFYRYELYHKSFTERKDIIAVVLDNCTKGETNFKSKNICAISIDKGNTNEFEIAGISLNSTREEVISTFGVPTKIEKHDYGVETLTYRKSNNQGLSFVESPEGIQKIFLYNIRRK